jgi:hypothetical protein
MIKGFHFLQLPNREMEIVRVEVIKAAGRKRQFQPFWLKYLWQSVKAR